MLRFLKRRRKELLLLIAATLSWTFLFFLLSIIFHPTISKNNWVIGTTRFDPELGWAPVSNLKGWIFGNVYTVTNSQGFRGEEVDPKKQHILVMGDSVAWGFNVADNETLPHFLQQEFNQHNHPQVQVLNLGVPGYGLDQEYLSLQKHINQANPKLILFIIYTGNDLDDTTHDSAYGKSKPLYRWVDDQLQLTNTPISKNSCMNYLSSSWLSTFKGMQGYLTRICPTHALEEEERDLVMKGLVAHIRQLAREHSTPVLFLISPRITDYQKPSETLRYFQNLLNSTPHLDAYKEVRNATSLYLDDGHHYSKEGNRYFAHLIYQRLTIAKSIVAKS